MPTAKELAAFAARFLLAVQKLEREKKQRFQQTELAVRWKVSQGTVSRCFAGKGIPDRATIKRIAADCGVDPGWLDWGTVPASTGDPSGPGGGENRREG